MNEKWKSWMEVAQVLHETPGAEICCPECKVGMLEFKDELIRGLDKVDGYIFCNGCGAYAVLSRVSKNNP
ncbi:hypothetical protein [Chitinophaga caseinilytica]|uniref:Transcription factor zinc-finger domain-containing protein n=1 Tax=Chitinophaga caseinilytica TaxID=2267521 RepID=A0ABZ2Z3C0_9BACT